MAVGIGGRERVALVVVGRRADPALARRMRERVHGAVEAEPGEARGLAPARAEAGAPEEALRLGLPEAACIAGNRGHRRVLSPGREDFFTDYFLTRSVACMPFCLWPGSEHQSA